MSLPLFFQPVSKRLVIISGYIYLFVCFLKLDHTGSGYGTIDCIDAFRVQYRRLGYSHEISRQNLLQFIQAVPDFVNVIHRMCMDCLSVSLEEKDIGKHQIVLCLFLVEYDPLLLPGDFAQRLLHFLHLVIQAAASDNDLFLC